MRKKALIYVVASPGIYLYGLAENHFNFSQTIRAYNLEFAYEYINAWRILFGKEYSDNSVAVATYDFKVKAKKAKFDVDIALAMKELFGSSWIRFDKKKRSIKYSWSSDYGSKYVRVSQLGKDRFELHYSDDSGWKNEKSLTTDYIFSKEGIIDTIAFIKNIK